MLRAVENGGGGLPEYSFNIIAGAPGCGKTTLAHQIMFANATPERPALYFTVLGEPAIKMLRYQQQYSFFDGAKMDGAIRFINLSQIVLDQDLGAVLDAIIKEVEASKASVVVVDSFRTVVGKALNNASEVHCRTRLRLLPQAQSNRTAPHGSRRALIFQPLELGVQLPELLIKIRDQRLLVGQ